MPSTTLTHKKKQQIILWVLGTLIALGPLSIDMYLPAFEQIAQDFSIPKSQVGYSLTTYFIGIALGQLMYGPVMDKFGRKTPLLFGLVLYIFAALICFFSPNIWWLMAARFLQAIGASAGMVASKAVVRDVFKPEEVARAISFLMLIMGGAPIVAPTLGGFIIHHLHWPYIFLALVIVASLMFVSVFRFLPDNFPADYSVNLNPIEVTKKYVGIFKNKIFLTYSLAGSLCIGALFAYIANAPVLFTDKFHFTELQFGWLFGLNAAGLIAGSQLNRVVLKRFSTYQTTKFVGFILLVFSILLVVFSLYVDHYISILGCLFVILFLLGFQNPNTTALSLYPFTRKAGRASALVGSFKMILGAVSSFVISSFSGQYLLPMAICIFLCFLLSYVLLIGFEGKEKAAVSFLKSAK